MLNFGRVSPFKHCFWEMNFGLDSFLPSGELDGVVFYEFHP